MNVFSLRILFVCVCMHYGFDPYSQFQANINNINLYKMKKICNKLSRFQCAINKLSEIHKRKICECVGKNGSFSIFIVEGIVALPLHNPFYITNAFLCDREAAGAYGRHHFNWCISAFHFYRSIENWWIPTQSNVRGWCCCCLACIALAKMTMAL